MPELAISRLTIASPVGPLALRADGSHLIGLDFIDRNTVNHQDNPTDQDNLADPGDLAASCRATTPLLAETARQLAAYFADRLELFDLPLAPAGTVFQRRVYDALLAIPYGTTKTYGHLAQELGSVARAVGGACGANPIPIIIPCHRILAGGGKTGGFSGGRGVSTKLQLLQLESRRLVLTCPS